MGIKDKKRSLLFVDARLPINQKVIAGNWVAVSAIYLRSEIRAEKMD
jgi:hypothetical protein